MITNRMHSGDNFAVAYTDLDNFKAYNDKYGFQKGDEVILFTAQILQQMWAAVGLNVKLELKENWSQIETDEVAEGRGIINWSATAIFRATATTSAQE